MPFIFLSLTHHSKETVSVKSFLKTANIHKQNSLTAVVSWFAILYTKKWRKGHLKSRIHLEEGTDTAVTSIQHQEQAGKGYGVSEVL